MAIYASQKRSVSYRLIIRFTRLKKALPMLLVHPSLPSLRSSVWKHIFPQFFPPSNFSRTSEKSGTLSIDDIFFFFSLHYCSLAWLTIATMLRLIVRVIVSSSSASTVIKYFVSTSVHASSSRFRKMRLWQFCLGGSLFVIYGCCFR